jgi:hypothetical protein
MLDREIHPRRGNDLISGTQLISLLYKIDLNLGLWLHKVLKKGITF